MRHEMSEKFPPPGDRYARESFTFRRMKPWQIWSMGTVAVLVLIGLVGSYYW